MTTISLSVTETLSDLLPGRAGSRKAQISVVVGEAAPARPLRLRLLPRSWSQALDHRARQRELEQAFARLAETSPHLLADVGLGEARAAEAAPPMTWTRALPSPAGASSAPPLGRWSMWRSRRRLADLDGHLLTDIGVTRAQAMQEARRPDWDAPHAWLR